MQRPTGVTVISVLGFIGAGLLFLASLGMFLGGALLSSMAGQPGFGMIAGIGVAAILGALVANRAAYKLRRDAIAPLVDRIRQAVEASPESGA